MKPLRGFGFVGAYFSIDMNTLRAKFTYQLIINFSFSKKMGYFAKSIILLKNGSKKQTQR